MPPLRWSANALRSVERLYDFLVAKNPQAALRAVQTIRESVQMLGTHPEIGHPVDDLPPEFHEWTVDFGHGAYIVLYRYDGREVVLLAVHHSREAGY